LVEKRYEWAVSWLRDVAHGLIDIAPPEEEQQVGGVAYSRPEPIFTRMVW
jgi:phage gp36-like protein